MKAMRPNATMGTTANPYNMWGAFIDNTNASPSCVTTDWNKDDDGANPNCDQPSPRAAQAIAVWDAANN